MLWSASFLLFGCVSTRSVFETESTTTDAEGAACVALAHWCVSPFHLMPLYAAAFVAGCSWGSLSNRMISNRASMNRPRRIDHQATRVKVLRRSYPPRAAGELAGRCMVCIAILLRHTRIWGTGVAGGELAPVSCPREEVWRHTRVDLIHATHLRRKCQHGDLSPHPVAESALSSARRRTRSNLLTVLDSACRTPAFVLPDEEAQGQRQHGQSDDVLPYSRVRVVEVGKEGQARNG